MSHIGTGFEPVTSSLSVLPASSLGAPPRNAAHRVIDLARQAAPIDGRHERGVRSRTAMVEAVLALLAEGNTTPSSAQIAARAGVTQRTLFNQFGDMRSLIAAVAARQLERAVEALPEAGTGTFEQRASRYCSGLANFLEMTMHVRWAVMTNPNADWARPKMVRAVRDFMRGRVRDAFSPELDVLTPTDREQVIDALELETDPLVWRVRRLQQGLTIDEGRRVVERTIKALVNDALRAAING